MQENSQRNLLDGAMLMQMENQLCELLGHFISFRGHALYFPANPGREAELLAREKKLLLPLLHGGRALGALLLHGVGVRQCRRLLDLLPRIASLCLGRLALAVNLRRDSLTGLANEEELYARMAQEAEFLGGEKQGPAHLRGQVALYRMCLGLLVFRFCDAREALRRQGYLATDEFLRGMAGCLAELPGEAMAARCGRYDLAVLFHASGRTACQDLARSLLGRMAGLRIRDGVTGGLFSPRLCCGHALYPQDMEGGEISLPMYEQARLLMDKARLAARTVEEFWDFTPRLAAPVLPFANILLEGGRILQELPPAGLRVSLGRSAKAEEGMRFGIRGLDAGGKLLPLGELVLVRVDEDESLAEIISLADPARLPRAGDSLLLVGSAGPDAASRAAERPGAGDRACPDAGRRCLGHADFLSRLAGSSRKCQRYSVALLRLDACAPADSRPETGREKLDSALDLWRESFGQESGAIAGYYGSNSLIFFHPGKGPADLLEGYRALGSRCQAAGLGSACGLAGYPYLHFERAETEKLALKALDYAMLLPEPRVGMCNSLALNISADRQYSLGDIFGAMQEYRQALMADRGNIMALNSLGVCQAALGNFAEAMRSFRKALALRPEKRQAAQICYNLGTVCQSMRKSRGAAIYYRKCLEHAPDHLYAHLRLGRLCEDAGRKAEARAYYERAASLEGKNPGDSSLARLQLARLARGQRKNMEARELLHDALVSNPRDAGALLLLAQTYMDNDEDPAMAELLARKSIGLRESRGAFETLARALRALGREDESLLAEARAASL